MAQTKKLLDRLLRLVTSEIWAPIILIFVLPALLTVSLPGLRSLDSFYALLYGSFIFVSLILSGLLAPLLNILHFQFDIPSYRPWKPSEVVFVILTNAILISIVTIFIYYRFTKQSLDGMRAKVSAIAWAVFIIQLVGELPLMWLIQDLSMGVP
jgi:uncharacterized membrane protein